MKTATKTRPVRKAKVVIRKSSLSRKSASAIRYDAEDITEANRIADALSRQHNK